MRRLPIGGTGWLVLAAAAAPIIIKSAKPLARKIGEAMEKYGQKLKDSSEEEVPNKHKETERPEPKDPETPPKETESPDAPETPDPPKAAATKVKQTKPAVNANSKPRPKKTVKATPAKPKTSAKKSEASTD